MRGLRSRWSSASGPARAVALALGALLALGIGLRLVLMISRGPAFLGAWDSNWYVDAAHHDLFSTPTWPVGYQVFLRGVHALVPDLSVTIAIQHALGVATALLLFSIVRRVAPAAWGLVPAAVVLLAGPQVLLEHAPLSETLFTFLVAASCACAVRALLDEQRGWAVAAGLVGVAAGCVRPVGLLLPALIVVWLAASIPGGRRRRLTVAGIVALSAWLPLAAYVTAARYEMGYVGPGLVRAGGWALYARVAPFADCKRFTPPPDARRLCETSPPSKRLASPFYLQASPAIRSYGSFLLTRPAHDRAMSAFAREAIVHQPLDYLRAVGTDVTRFWSAEATDSRLSHDYDGYFDSLADRNPEAAHAVRAWYATAGSLAPRGIPSALRTYEQHTRLQGPPFVLLVLLAVIGVALSRGRRLAVGLLMLAVSAATLVGPIATLYFHPRYAIPGYGVLAAAGAIGAASIWERATALQVGRRPVRRRAVTGGATDESGA